LFEVKGGRTDCGLSLPSKALHAKQKELYETLVSARTLSDYYAHSFAGYRERTRNLCMLLSNSKTYGRICRLHGRMEGTRRGGEQLGGLL
jgi:hypothetical protein